MSRDSDLASLDRKNELLESELEMFMDNAFGNFTQDKTTWM